MGRKRNFRDMGGCSRYRSDMDDEYSHAVAASIIPDVDARLDAVLFVHTARRRAIGHSRPQKAVMHDQFLVGNIGG